MPGMEPLALFRTLAQNPRVLRRIQRGGLLDPGSISLRLRELVILRTCALCGADYEWGVHAALFADAAGLDADERRAGPEAPGWTDAERLVLRMCDELHGTATLDDELATALAAEFSHAQLVELLTLAGLYHAISFVVNVSGVSPEAWAETR
jgi:alkylhydroperoxidase family enzyme